MQDATKVKVMWEDSSISEHESHQASVAAFRV